MLHPSPVLLSVWERLLIRGRGWLKLQLLAIDLVLLPVGADSISLTGHVYVG